MPLHELSKCHIHHIISIYFIEIDDNVWHREIRNDRKKFHNIKRRIDRFKNGPLVYSINKLM